MQRHPILSQTCRTASSTAESRFRIDRGEIARRDSRILALDPKAADIVRDLAELEWRGGHFLTYDSSAPGQDATTADAVVRDASGTERRLSDEVQGADVVVMIGTEDASPDAAALVGDLCAARGVMSAALIVADEGDVDAAIGALRPNAMVLVLLRDGGDIPDMLTALRA